MLLQSFHQELLPIKFPNLPVEDVYNSLSHVLLDLVLLEENKNPCKGKNVLRWIISVNRGGIEAWQPPFFPSGAVFCMKGDVSQPSYSLFQILKLERFWSACSSN